MLVDVKRDTNISGAMQVLAWKNIKVQPDIRVRMDMTLVHTVKWYHNNNTCLFANGDIELYYTDVERELVTYEYMLINID